MTEGLELAKFQLKTLVTQVQKFMDMSPVFRLGPFWHATVEKASLFFWADFVHFGKIYLTLLIFELFINFICV